MVFPISFGRRLLPRLRRQSPTFRPALEQLEDRTVPAAIAFTGPFTTPAAAGNLSSVATGDFNGDGKRDAVINTPAATNPGRISLLRGNGNGTFTPFVPGFLIDATTCNYVALGDLNGDNKLDIVAETTNGKVDVFLGNGNG